MSAPRAQILASEYSLTTSRGVAISLARATILTNLHALVGWFLRSYVSISRLTINSDDGGIAFSIWSTAEAAVILLCTCLPIMRPMFIDMYHKLPSTRRTRYSLQPLVKRGLSKPQQIPEPQSFAMSSTPRGTRRSEIWGLSAARDEESELGR